jgi:predicted nucleic acid-binding protein
VSLLLDNSAWARIVLGLVPNGRASEIGDQFAAGEVMVASPFLLEAGFSARGAAEHSALFERLLALPFLAMDEQAERRALDAQSQLARAGRHRLAPADLMIAAIAERHGVGVLHYDADYDLIATVTGQKLEWVASRGSLR